MAVGTPGTAAAAAAGAVPAAAGRPTVGRQRPCRPTHLSLQRCTPQGSSLSQVEPQGGTTTSQAASGTTTRPQGQALTPARAHSPQSPAWHTRPQRWRPQASARPQARAQRKAPCWLQGSAAVSAPQRQGTSETRAQGGQGPGWQASGQAWPQGSAAPQPPSQLNSWRPQRLSVTKRPQ